MTLRLFEGYGIELEYMIVAWDRLQALPVSDRVLEAVAGEIVSEVEVGDTAWSNELVLHVIELKTNGPAKTLEELPAKFSADLRRINGILKPLAGHILPTAMHPFFDPSRETKLWPHEYNAVYETYDRIFGCKGHGWSNLQSMHINLPFGDDVELGKLHAAIRLILPLLPAIAASSPIVEGRATGILDNRLQYYRNNSRKIPAATGKVIPEPVFDKASYHREILERIWAATAPYDPEGVLRDEWANARGAIARFDRDAIEIRVIDVQECPSADLAIAAATVAALKALVYELWIPHGKQRSFAVEPLHAVFLSSMLEGEAAIISDRELLEAFGYPAATRCTAGELWAHVVESTKKAGLLDPRWDAQLAILLQEGTLARRILRAIGPEMAPDDVLAVYRLLADCLQEDRLFRA